MKNKGFILVLLLLFVLISCGSTKEYEVNFVNGDLVVETQTVQENSLLNEPIAPTKEATAEYEYIFDGWYDGENKWDFANDKVSSDLTLKARFIEEDRMYVVTFKNSDGTTLSTQNVKYNDKVTLPEEPNKEATAQYEYIFEGWYNGEEKWDFANNKVTGDLTLKAKYTEETRVYVVTFKNEDGTVIKEEQLEYGVLPEAPANPSKPSTVEMKYEFSGWDKNISEVTGTVVYTAQYTASKQVYSIKFMLDEETELVELSVEYGDVPVCTVNPEKPDTETTKYVFKGWDSEVVAVTGDAVYTATFDTYTIGKGNIETFSENIYLNTESSVSGYYNYTSTNSGTHPLVISSDQLELLVLGVSSYGGVSIDFGKVESGKNYLIRLDVDMLKADGTKTTDGFAYAFTSIEGSTSTSAGGLLTSFKLLDKVGKFEYLFTAEEDLDHLYLVIRSQKDKGYVESKLVIDNVICEETIISISNTNSILSGSLSDDFAVGLIAQDSTNNKIIRYYGAINAYTPNLNSTLEYVDGALRLKHSVNANNGLYAIKVEGLVAGNTYEITMDLDMFDAEGNNVNSSTSAYFRYMVYVNNDSFSANRCKIYDVNNTDLGITPLVQDCLVEGNTYKFTIVAPEDGYACITLRSEKNLGSIYADLSNFTMNLLTNE